MARITKEYRFGIANLPQKAIRFFHLHSSIFEKLVGRLIAGNHVTLEPEGGQGEVKVNVVFKTETIYTFGTHEQSYTP